MKEPIENRSKKKVHDVANLSSAESRERSSFIINSLLPKTPTTDLKRFGNNNDGGYVIANDLKSSDYLLSFGVAEDISFESEASIFIDGMDLYDYSIDAPPYQIYNSRFFKEKVGYSLNSSTVSIQESLNRCKDKNDYILKVDIEGSEWDLFNNVEAKYLLMFRQIVVEFHWIDKILDNDHYPIIKNALYNINQTHQTINVHGNNYGDIIQFSDFFIPEVLEVTFLRKNSYTFKDYDEDLFNMLNNPSDPNSLDISFIYTKEIE